MKKNKKQSQISTVFSRNLYQGMKDGDVKQLQKFLNSDPSTRLKVANGDSGSFGNETNVFGPLTAEAVQRFQLKYGVVEVGPKTREKIREILEVLPMNTENSKTSRLVWYAPVPRKYFAVSQLYLNYDPVQYKKFGYHTGTDYGGCGQSGIPLFACTDGEIIFRDIANSPWGAFFGNHIVLYVPTIDKSFMYCHMANTPRQTGSIKAGKQIGRMGNTGQSAKGAIHLHLQGYHGRFKASWRKFNTLDEIKTRTFDAHELICLYL